MDIDATGDNPMKYEECFFDAMHSRVRGYKTLSAFVCCRPLRMIVRLASMEVKSEDTKSVKLFWQFLNEAINEATGGKQTKFNPYCILVDAAGANYSGITEVFGPEFVKDRVRSCLQHYLSNVNEYARKIPDPTIRLEFVDNCKRMVNNTTVHVYTTCLYRLKSIGHIFSCVIGFVKWWDLRKYHVFGAFRGQHFKRANQAEAGHAMLKRRGRQGMWMNDAAEDDIATFMVQQEKCEQFLAGEIPSTGQGPTQSTLAEDARSMQIRRAHDWTRLLDNRVAMQAEYDEATHPAQYQPGNKDGHKPRAKKITKKMKEKLEKQKQEEEKEQQRKEDEKEETDGIQEKDVTDTCKTLLKSGTMRKLLQQAEATEKGKRGRQKGAIDTTLPGPKGGFILENFMHVIHKECQNEKLIQAKINTVVLNTFNLMVARQVGEILNAPDQEEDEGNNHRTRGSPKPVIESDEEDEGNNNRTIGSPRPVIVSDEEDGTDIYRRKSNRSKRVIESDDEDHHGTQGEIRQRVSPRPFIPDEEEEEEDPRQTNQITASQYRSRVGTNDGDQDLYAQLNVANQILVEQRQKPPPTAEPRRRRGRRRLEDDFNSMSQGHFSPADNNYSGYSALSQPNPHSEPEPMGLPRPTWPTNRDVTGKKYPRPIADNRPRLTLLQGRISRCSGCMGAIDRRVPPPYDLVFHMRADRHFIPMHATNRRMRSREQNAYFHLKVECLRCLNGQITVKDIWMSIDIYKELSAAHLRFIHYLGFLDQINQCIEERAEIGHL